MLRYVPATPFDQPAAGSCLVRAHALRLWLLERYPGADNLGCYVDRAMTGGTAPSVHRDGRAIDVGFLDDEASRQDCYALLVEHAWRLGIQMVLNYQRDGSPSSGVLWRLPRYENETEPFSGSWTRRGHWLHIEIHPDHADDTLPIEDILGPAVPGDPPTLPNKELTVDVHPHRVARGDRGGWVRKLQMLLPGFGQDPGAADGIFGPRTLTAVLHVQRFFGLVPDGIVGPKTWGVLLGVAPE